MGLSLHLHPYFVYASNKGFYEYVISTEILHAGLYNFTPTCDSL